MHAKKVKSKGLQFGYCPTFVLLRKFPPPQWPLAASNTNCLLTGLLVHNVRVAVGAGMAAFGLGVLTPAAR
jgi:hypothetical protein